MMTTGDGWWRFSLTDHLLPEAGRLNRQVASIGLARISLEGGAMVSNSTLLKLRLLAAALDRRLGAAAILALSDEEIAGLLQPFLAAGGSMEKAIAQAVEQVQPRIASAGGVS
jgi:hypothetical protein